MDDEVEVGSTVPEVDTTVLKVGTTVPVSEMHEGVVLMVYIVPVNFRESELPVRDCYSTSCICLYVECHVRYKHLYVVHCTKPVGLMCTLRFIAALVFAVVKELVLTVEILLIDINMNSEDDAILIAGFSGHWLLEHFFIVAPNSLSPV